MSEEDQHQVESNNLKIAVTAILSVLFGAAFLLALINFGIGMQQKVDREEEARRKNDEIVSIISVDHSVSTFGYTLDPVKDDDGNLTVAPVNSLVSSLKEGYSENYLVIDSSDMLEKALDEIRSLSGNNKISYKVDNNFFQSGSVIMLTAEGNDVQDLKINAVSRDTDNNIQIDAKAVKANASPDTMDTYGKAAFIKIPNIQPKSVTVNMDK